MKLTTPLLFILAASILVSCGAPTTETTGESGSGKTDFIIESTLASDLPSGQGLEKVARLTSSSQITLSSQWVGRVKNILVRDGESVTAGDPIITLADTTGNYLLSLESARASLARAKSDRESTRVRLDTAFVEARRALERAENTYNTTRSDSEKKLEKARYDEKSTALGSGGSSSDLTLTKIEADIVKAQSDIDTLIRRQEQTLANYSPSYQVTVSDLTKTLSTLLYESDRLVGVSLENRNVNDSFETYLGARDASLKPQIENAFPRLQSLLKDLENRKSMVVDQNSLLRELDGLDSAYRDISAYSDLIVRILEQSVESAPSFSRPVIDGYLAQFNGYKAQIQGLKSAYVSFRSGAATFLSTYESERRGYESSLNALQANYGAQKRSLETTSFDTRNALSRTEIATTDAITVSKIAVSSAQSSFDEADSNRGLSLEKADIAVREAEIALERATKDAEKLTIRAPISARVNRVYVSNGEEIPQWTRVADVLSSQSEVSVDVDAVIADSLSIGATLQVRSSDGKESATGTVVGISAGASESLLKTLRIEVADSTKFTSGTLIRVMLPFASEHPLLPLSSVEIIGVNQARIYTLSGGTVSTEIIEIGQTLSGQVTVLSDLPSDLRIILSDAREYDEKTMRIVENPAQK